MIAAHDTYTYLNTSNCIINLFSLFWRCQKKSPEELYQLGVRVFDIRVINEKDHWRIGHGLAKVKKTFKSLLDICNYFDKNFNGSYLRIILEQGGKNNDIVTKYQNEVDEIVEKYDYMIWSICIKNPWQEIYKDSRFEVLDYCCRLFNWDLGLSLKENLKRIDIKSWNIKSWAKIHNPLITKEMIEDQNKIYLIDYIGVYPK